MLFLKGAFSLLGAAAAPSASRSPTPQASLNPWDTCLQNPVLPYDHPLEIKMRVLDGPDFDLLKYRGRPTLLHIFATWCQPCAIEMPHIVAIANAYAPKGLAVVGVNFRESDDAVRAYRKRFGITFPVAMDQDGGFTEHLESGTENITLPASLYIDSHGYLDCYTQGTTTDPGPEVNYRVEQFIKDASS